MFSRSEWLSSIFTEQNNIWFDQVALFMHSYMHRRPQNLHHEEILFLNFSMTFLQNLKHVLITPTFILFFHNLIFIDLLTFYESFGIDIIARVVTFLQFINFLNSIALEMILIAHLAYVIKRVSSFS